MPEETQSILERLEPFKRKLIYLAVPYWSKAKHVRWRRYWCATKLARKLLQLGYKVFSPVTHGHAIAEASVSKPVRGIDWLNQVDLPILYNCGLLLVLELPGHKSSQGLALEITVAVRECKPIRTITEAEMETLCK